MLPCRSTPFHPPSLVFHGGGFFLSRCRRCLVSVFLPRSRRRCQAGRQKRSCQRGLAAVRRICRSCECPPPALLLPVRSAEASMCPFGRCWPRADFTLQAAALFLPVRSAEASMCHHPGRFSPAPSAPAGGSIGGYYDTPLWRSLVIGQNFPFWWLTIPTSSGILSLR